MKWFNRKMRLLIYTNSYMKKKMPMRRRSIVLMTAVNKRRNRNAELLGNDLSKMCERCAMFARRHCSIFIGFVKSADLLFVFLVSKPERITQGLAVSTFLYFY